MLTALAVWFGWTYTNARGAYLGIDSSVLGFTPSDYLFRSADAMFVPIAILLIVALVTFSLHELVSAVFVRRRVRGGVAFAAVTLGAGLALAVAGVRAMFVPVPLLQDHYLLPPIVLGGGVTLAAYGAWMLRRLAAAESFKPSIWDRLIHLSAVILALLCVFWASTLYATALGRGRGAAIEHDLSSRPQVTVFSRQPLDLATTTIVAARGSTYRYRYSGLRLIVHSAGRYFLVTDGWTHHDGTMIVLDESPGIRIEFTPGENS